LGTKHIL